MNYFKIKFTKTLSSINMSICHPHSIVENFMQYDNTNKKKNPYLRCL
jgi:hypothetical protein